MKTKAIILLLCFSVYFIDTFAAADCQRVRPAKGMCCKMMSKQCHPTKCPKKPKDCNKDCFNCPLFYSATLPDLTIVSTGSLLIEKKFCFHPQRRLSTYHNDIWKPPNPSIS